MRWARPLWIVIALLGIILFIADETASWPFLHTVCRAACHSGQPDPAAAQTLHARGISLRLFAGLSVGRDVLNMLIWFGMSALVVLHRPRERGPMVAAFFLLLFAMNPSNSVANPPGWGPLLTVLDFVAGSVYVLFGLLFPDGRFVPRWTRWIALLWVSLIAWQTILPNGPADQIHVPGIILLVVPLALIASVLGAQGYRYRRVSSWEERQQTKWVLFGVGISVVGMVILNIGYAVAPGGSTPGSVYDLSAYWLFPLVNDAIPVAIAVAMLRGQLWDVDRVINQTLVYGSLTVTLAAVYLGGVVGLEALAHRLTGQSSDIAIAVVTLAVAALFNPWRRRLQAFIDRRFYRHKYDASRILAAFTATLRDEVDLDDLSTDIAAVVQETVQPSHFSFWIRPESVP